MAKLNLKDALNTSLARTKLYIDTELAKKADSSHGTHLTLGTGSGNAYRGDYGNTAYQHSQAAHAPSNAQKNSDITKAEIEAKLTGAITTHTHNYAGSSSVGGAANSAVKATQDSAGQQINTTYIKGLSVSGKTITYTKGDGTTGTITTQDTNTTYNAATQSAAGLMSADDKKKLDGIAASANNYSHPNSGVTASSYGPSANASPAHSGTFSVPYITVNAAGHITSASTKTITLPADNNTWRGVQNNLTSDATDQSLSAAQGKALKALIDGKADSSHGTHVSYGGNGSATTVSRSDHTHSYLPLSGGTMTGNITFTDVTSTTYPAKSKTISWSGSTDGADIYYQVDASDKGRLVLNTKDDADCIIAFANKGTIISTIDNSGNFSGKAATATKATQDSTGQQINTTYIKGLSVSGKTITYTKGDGTTGTITTQDTNTTYSAATTSAAGLMSAADKTKLDGIATSANNYSHPNSGATAGSYGPSANASPAHSGTFSVPYITINAAGHVTSASTKTITLPSDNNTWRGIQNNLTSDSTSDSLSAAQGKALKALIDGKAASSHGTHVAYGGNGSATTVSRSDHTHDYLPKSGGTISSSNFGPFTITRSGSTNGASIKFTNSSGTLGYIGMSGAINGGLQRWSSDTNTSYTVLDTGNYKTHVTPANIGASATGHTHNYAGSSSSGGAANSVKTNLTIKLNGGSTEGTNLFTFNGSTAKTINITPSSIGAAASSHGTHLTIGTGASNAAAGNHTHSYAGSSSAGGAATSANKVNTNLVIKLNSGSTEGTNLFTFNGSTAKTINITPSAIGAAASSHGTHLTIGTGASNAAAGNHTHSYLPLSGGTVTGTLNISPDSIANATFASTYTTLRKPVTMSSDCTVSGSLIAPGGTTTSLLSLTATNAYTEFQYGHGVVRVAEKNHLYLQAGSLVGETAAEVRCTLYKKASEYTNLRAYNLCAQGAVYAQGTNISSDRTLKENIKYISNANTINDEEITIMDCYNFIKDDLGLATYNYIDDAEKQQKIGFIAQDVLYDPIKQTDNKIGQLVITKLLGSEQLDPENPKLTYDVNNILGVMLGAMQVTANKTAALEQENKELKELVNNLITRIEKLEQK